jgi:hypothetical protein
MNARMIESVRHNVELFRVSLPSRAMTSTSSSMGRGDTRSITGVVVGVGTGVCVLVGSGVGVPVGGATRVRADPDGLTDADGYAIAGAGEPRAITAFLLKPKKEMAKMPQTRILASTRRTIAVFSFRLKPESEDGVSTAAFLCQVLEQRRDNPGNRSSR